jgi:hypothetical protein
MSSKFLLLFVLISSLVACGLQRGRENEVPGPSESVKVGGPCFYFDYSNEARATTSSCSIAKS